MPSSGKTTIFNAVSGSRGEIGGFHQGLDVNHAIAKVPDLRLDRLAGVIPPEKITPATIEYIDVPGVMVDPTNDNYVRYLAALRETDALAHIIRYFNDPAAPHPRGSIDPARDAAEVLDELVLADLQVVENRLAKIDYAERRGLDSDDTAREKELMEKCRDALEGGEPLNRLELSDKEMLKLRTFAFLTLKPMLFVLNVEENLLGKKEADDAAAALGPDALVMSGKLEMEIAELSPGERQEFIEGLGIGEPGGYRMVNTCYRMLGLASYFTAGPKEVRAWTVTAGDDAVTAASKIHSDIARGFIRAEVVHYDDLVSLGSFKAVKDAGKFRLEGKTYRVCDGDVITFRFNV